MTTGDSILRAGLMTGLRIHGRQVVASTGEKIKAMVDDAPELQDPTQIAQAKTPVYTRLTAPAKCVSAPRSVTSFTESETTRAHRVLRFEESSASTFAWVWICEAQRI